MDFWKTMGVLLRRWYVALPVFLISLGVAGGVFFTVSTQYESTGTIVLTSPSGGAVAARDPSKSTGPGNPLLDFEGSLTITSQLLTQSLASPTAHKTIVAQGGADTFTAGDGQTGGPFVVIIGDANSPAQAERTVALALDYARTELNDRQKTLDAPPSTFIVPQNVVTPTPASTKIGGKVRAAGVALVLGLVASLTAAYGIESYKTRKRRGDDDDGGKVADDRDDTPDEPDAAQPEDDESATPTKKMMPAPPPRRRPVPAPVPMRGGPRPSPHPVVSSLGPNPPNADFPRNNGVNGNRPDGFGPGHRPHPAKPRPAPANGSGNANGANGNGGNGGSGNNGSGSTAGRGGSNGNGPGAGNGNGSNPEWPRADFRAPGTTG